MDGNYLAFNYDVESVWSSYIPDDDGYPADLSEMEYAKAFSFVDAYARQVFETPIIETTTLTYSGMLSVIDSWADKNVAYSKTSLWGASWEQTRKMIYDTIDSGGRNILLAERIPPFSPTNIVNGIKPTNRHIGWKRLLEQRDGRVLVVGAGLTASGAGWHLSVDPSASGPGYIDYLPHSMKQYRLANKVILNNDGSAPEQWVAVIEV